MEYKMFAKYYDKFYQKKNYEKEVEFLENILPTNSRILDVGCGTGVHGELLEKSGYLVDGLDLNKEMLDIAKNRISGNLYCQNMLNIDINKKYDAIISMFAVINHLKEVDELDKVLSNLKKLVFPNGLIIIDLHNPQCSGIKTDLFDNVTRTMCWDYDKDKMIEKTELIFEIDGQIYKDNHIFKIFTIEQIEKSCDKAGLKLISVYENYQINKIGTSSSKNLQFLIRNNFKN